jgi:hypothetical protein
VGTLSYDTQVKATFDDRVLAHLQIVIWAKLRRGEQFSFTWAEPGSGVGRTSIWVSSTIPISFQFFGSKSPAINPAWIVALNKSANSAAGLQLVPEPVDAPD